MPAPAVISSGSAVERVDGGAEHQVGVARELAQPLGERLVVAVCEQAPARLGGRLAWPRHGDPRIARDREAQAGARAHQRHALCGSQRQPERVQLGAAADEQLAVQLERDEVPGNRERLDADVGDEPARGRPRTREDVRAEVQPVGVARLAADAAAEAPGGLEDDDVAIAQIPRGREARDAAADDDRVAYGLVLAAGGVAGQAAESSAGVV